MFLALHSGLLQHKEIMNSSASVVDFFFPLCRQADITTKHDTRKTPLRFDTQAMTPKPDIPIDVEDFRP